MLSSGDRSRKRQQDATTISWRHLEPDLTATDSRNANSAIPDSDEPAEHELYKLDFKQLEGFVE